MNSRRPRGCQSSPGTTFWDQTPNLPHIVMERCIVMTLEIQGLLCIVFGHRIQMWTCTYTTKSLCACVRFQFPQRRSTTSTLGLAPCPFFFPCSAHCILIPPCKMLSLRCLWEWEGKKHSHSHTHRHTNTLTSRGQTSADWNPPRRHIVKTHLSSVHNPSCVNQMITPYRENFRARR